MKIRNRVVDRRTERLRYRKWRHLQLEILGGRCSKCGITDKRVLQIDHVQGDGNLAHNKLGKMPPKKVFRLIEESLAKDENRFQLLCANCNWIKRYNNDEMPRAKEELTGEFE